MITTLLNAFRANKNYLSEIDKFLADFDKKNPMLSASQKAEKDAYQQLYHQRDSIDKSENKNQ